MERIIEREIVTVADRVAGGVETPHGRTLSDGFTDFAPQIFGNGAQSKAGRERYPIISVLPDATALSLQAL
ncbi:MAG: hypothetical protein C0483_08135 [Pirellula sp.]|nr:hypothetical protein [Pirellula sp.]